MFYCKVLTRRYSGSAASASVALQPAQLKITAAAASAATDVLARAQVGWDGDCFSNTACADVLALMDVSCQGKMARGGTRRS